MPEFAAPSRAPGPSSPLISAALACRRRDGDTLEGREMVATLMSFLVKLGLIVGMVAVVALFVVVRKLLAPRSRASDHPEEGPPDRALGPVIARGEEDGPIPGDLVWSAIHAGAREEKEPECDQRRQP